MTDLLSDFIQDATDAEKGKTMPDQMALMPLTPEELRKKGRELAHIVSELAEMEEEHAQRRLEMKQEKERLLKHLRLTAQAIREQGIREGEA